MDCLIIAAGRGSRLGDQPLCKPMVPVDGTPLIEHVIRTARSAGGTAFTVVVGYRGAELKAFLGEARSRLDVPIRCIENPAWERANGVSVLVARDRMKGKFLLMMSDHLAEPGLLSGLVETVPGTGEVVLAVDRALRNPRVDLEDVTRVQVERGSIRAIGKGIDPHNGYDTGFFHCTPGLFEAIDESIRQSGDDSLSGGGRILAARGRFRAHEIGDAYWLDVDEPESLERAGREIDKVQGRG